MLFRSPIIQMQQQELAIKDRAQKAKEAKDQADIALKNKQITIDAIKAAGQMQTQKSIATKQMTVNAINDVAKRQHEKQMHEKDHISAVFQSGLKPEKQPKGE